MADPWSGVPQEYRNEIEDLEHQWEVDSGFPFAIEPKTLAAMARSRVVTYQDFSQYLWNNNLIPQSVKQKEPWIGFGLSQDQWHQTMSDYANTWQELTGQALDTSITGGKFGELSSMILKGESASQWHTKLQQDANMLKTYGWLRFGMNYTQFQQQKVAMRSAFGHDLSDQQAVTQLSYFQRFSSGGAGTATERPPQQPQQAADAAALSVVR